MKKIILLLIAIGLSIRIIVSFVGSYGDIPLYFIPWAKNISQFGYSNFYQRVDNANYPPIAIYVLSASYNAGTALADPLMNTLIKMNNSIPLFPSNLILFLNEQKIINSTIKFPFMISDILLALGIFNISKLLSKNKIIQLLILNLILFNPAFIYNSSVWGQIDVLPLTFSIWSIYFLIKKKLTISICLFVLGLLSKQTIGVFIPFYGILLLKNFKLNKIIKSSLISLSIMYLLFFPFFKSGNLILFPFTTFSTIATTFGGNSLSAHALNFWWMITNKAHLPDSTIFFSLFSASIWSKIFVGLIALYSVLISLRISKKNFLQFFILMSFFSMGVFLFSTRMHERHLLPAIPFLLVGGLIHPIYFVFFIITSIIHFFNLYASWGQPEFPLLKNVLNTAFYTNILIFIQIVIFLYIPFIFHKKNSAKNSE